MPPEEQQLIDFLEKYCGRKLTPQEIKVSLAQAYGIGEL
jgi:hypothetical protein